MPPNPSTSGGWKVVAQQETMGLSPLGAAVEGVKVTYQTDRGLQGTVFVPKDRYSPENVKAAILQAVSSLHAVQDLRG